MSILRIVIRHCSRCAAKTELCVTVFRSLKLWFLSIPKSSRHIQELSIDWLLDLAVDLSQENLNLDLAISILISALTP
jgi:hypothetical protein